MKDTDQTKTNSDSTSESGEQERLKRLYKFLLLKIDLGKKDSEKFQPNESFVGYQLGLENYRVFVRKILRAALPEYYENSDKEGNLAPSIELSKLVEILDSIEQYSSGIRNKYSKKQKSKKLPTKFTTQDKITALKLYSELSKKERDKLELPMDENAKLLAQLIERLNSPTIQQSKALLRKLYKATVEEGFTVSNPEVTSGVEKLQEIIIESVMKLLKAYYQDLPLEKKELEKEAIRYEGKVMREMYRILIQSGLQQLSEIIEPGMELAAVVKKLPNEIVSKLICSIVENEMLTQEFPIFIKWIDFKRVRPLPLRIKKATLPDGLLSDKLIDDSNDIGISGFENQTAHSVTVHFKMKNMDNTNTNEEPQDFSSEYFEFSEEITGIGSPASLATVAINRVLLWDIKCLREMDIFPTAKQILVHTTILDDSPHSAVWCHTLVQLHTRKSIEQVVDQSSTNGTESCDSLDLFNSQSHGDFCAFDVLESIIKSGLHARLRAIKNLGIDSKEYLEGLQYKVIESIVIRKAKSRLKFYPFSFWAMQGELERNLFAKNGEIVYRITHDPDELNSVRFEEKSNNRNWSLFAYEAHLTLAETLLNEGKQSAARQYLKQIQLHVNRSKPKCILTDLMKARYHYLMAKYLYLYDLKEGDGTYSDRSSAILAMRKELDEANKYMQHRIKMCEVIGELSQSNNHPFFSLLGKIKFLQARLHLGFCSYLNISYPENLKKVLMFLQMARVCAARDGNADEYSCYSAFQSWAYSMIAYSGEVELLKSLDLDKSKCLEWSKELINHATICYDETGRKSYEQVKFHAGDTESSEYGDVKIDKPPFIREFPNAITPKEHSADENPDIIHIPYFKSIFEPELKKNLSYGSLDVLVFGTNSSALFLAYGMQKLSHIESMSDINLREELDIIFQHLLAAYVTAKDGGCTKKEKGIKIIKRNFKPVSLYNSYPISEIRGLYLHRIGYIVPLSAIALYLCGILRMMNYHYLYASGGATLDTITREINDFARMKAEFLDDIHEKKDAEKSFNLQNTSQERFNGSIETHLARIIEYYRTVIEELQLTVKPVENPDDEEKLKNAEYMARWKNSRDYCLTWRDKLMKNLLRLIVGIGIDLID